MASFETNRYGTGLRKFLVMFGTGLEVKGEEKSEPRSLVWRTRFVQ